MQASDRVFYTYAYLNDDGSPYYIGKGTKQRAYAKHANVKVPKENKILILKKNLTEKEALDHENYMIFLYGRKSRGSGILENKMPNGSPNTILYKQENPDEWADSIISAIFGNRTAACVLLFIDKHEEAHAQRIAKTFGFGLNQTQRQLKKFEQNYVLESRKVGMIRLYSFNTRNPAVRNLREFLKASRIVQAAFEA